MKHLLLILVLSILIQPLKAQDLPFDYPEFSPGFELEFLLSPHQSDSLETLYLQRAANARAKANVRRGIRKFPYRQYNQKSPLVFIYDKQGRLTQLLNIRDTLGQAPYEEYHWHGNSHKLHKYFERDFSSIDKRYGNPAGKEHSVLIQHFNQEGKGTYYIETAPPDSIWDYKVKATQLPDGKISHLRIDNKKLKYKGDSIIIREYLYDKNGRLEAVFHHNFFGVLNTKEIAYNYTPEGHILEIISLNIVGADSFKGPLYFYKGSKQKAKHRLPSFSKKRGQWTLKPETDTLTRYATERYIYKAGKVIWRVHHSHLHFEDYDRTYRDKFQYEYNAKGQLIKENDFYYMKGKYVHLEVKRIYYDNKGRAIRSVRHLPQDSTPTSQNQVQYYPSGEIHKLIRQTELIVEGGMRVDEEIYTFSPDFRLLEEKHSGSKDNSIQYHYNKAGNLIRKETFKGEVKVYELNWEYE